MSLSMGLVNSDKVDQATLYKGSTLTEKGIILIYAKSVIFMTRYHDTKGSLLAMCETSWATTELARNLEGIAPS